MKKKIGAVLGALALAAGITVAAAPAQAASTPGPYTVTHGYDDTGIAPGNITVRRTDGTEFGIWTGASVGFTAGYTGGRVQYVRAGGGYCVWEESNGVNYNYGKGAPANSLYALQGFKTSATVTYGITSTLHIYFC